jgi:hypothetical protein
MAGSLRFCWAMVKSVFSIIMLTKRLKTLPSTLDRGLRGTAVARSLATASLAVEVLGTLTLCAEAADRQARAMAAKDSILSIGGRKYSEVQPGSGALKAWESTVEQPEASLSWLYTTAVYTIGGAMTGSPRRGRSSKKAERGPQSEAHRATHVG